MPARPEALALPWAENADTPRLAYLLLNIQQPFFGMRSVSDWHAFGGVEKKEETEMIEVRDLKKRFGSHEAVRGVSFNVDKGEVLGFLGPNGAGKTTTMRMVTGFLPPTSGTAIVCGHDITSAPVEAKQCIGYLPENAPAYESMTVTHFLQFCAEMRGLRGAARADATQRAIERCQLAKVRHQAISTLSKGYRQRACFAQAIIHDYRGNLGKNR